MFAVGPFGLHCPTPKSSVVMLQIILSPKDMSGVHSGRLRPRNKNLLYIRSLFLQVCSGDIREEDKETGAVLKCLVKNVDTVSDTCSREISRSLRAALQFYQPVNLTPLAYHPIPNISSVSGVQIDFIKQCNPCYRSMLAELYCVSFRDSLY